METHNLHIGFSPGGAIPVDLFQHTVTYFFFQEVTFHAGMTAAKVIYRNRYTHLKRMSQARKAIKNATSEQLDEMRTSLAQNHDSICGATENEFQSMTKNLSGGSCFSGTDGFLGDVTLLGQDEAPEGSDAKAEKAEADPDGELLASPTKPEWFSREEEVSKAIRSQVGSAKLFVMTVHASLDLVKRTLHSFSTMSAEVKKLYNGEINILQNRQCALEYILGVHAATGDKEQLLVDYIKKCAEAAAAPAEAIDPTAELIEPPCMMYKHLVLVSSVFSELKVRERYSSVTDSASLVAATNQLANHKQAIVDLQTKCKEGISNMTKAVSDQNKLQNKIAAQELQTAATAAMAGATGSVQVATFKGAKKASTHEIMKNVAANVPSLNEVDSRTTASI